MPLAERAQDPDRRPAAPAGDHHRGLEAVTANLGLAHLLDEQIAVVARASREGRGGAPQERGVEPRQQGKVR
jgi:hypothetical protein